MKHNSFKITESEKNRIKNLHETVKNNPKIDSSLVITEHQAQHPHRHSNPNSQSCRHLTCCDSGGEPYCPDRNYKSCPDTGYAWNGRSCVSNKKRGQTCCNCNHQNPQPASYPGGCPDVVGMVRAMGGSCREACRDFAPNLQSRKGGPEPSKKREKALGLNETTYELPIRYGKKRMSESQLVKMLRRISEEQELQEKGKACKSTSDCPHPQFCSGGGCVTIGGDDDEKTASTTQPGDGGTCTDPDVKKLMATGQNPNSMSQDRVIDFIYKILGVEKMMESKNRKGYIKEDWDEFKAGVRRIFDAWKQCWGAGKKGPIDLPTGLPGDHYPKPVNPLGEQKLSNIIRKVMNESQLLTEAAACDGLSAGAECYGGCGTGSCYIGKCDAEGNCVEQPADGGGRISFTDIKRKGGKAAANVIKGQGYNDKEDESLAMRRGKESSKKQSYKARRDDSYGKYGKRGKKLNERNLSNIIRKVMNEQQLLTEGPFFCCFWLRQADCCKEWLDDRMDGEETRTNDTGGQNSGRLISQAKQIIKSEDGETRGRVGDGRPTDGPIKLPSDVHTHYPKLNERKLSNIIRKVMSESEELQEAQKVCDAGACNNCGPTGSACEKCCKNAAQHTCGDCSHFNNPADGGKIKGFDDVSTGSGKGRGRKPMARRGKPMGKGRYGEGPGGTVYYPDMPGLGESRLSNVIKKAINERMYLTEADKACDEGNSHTVCGECVKKHMKNGWSGKNGIDQNCFSSEKQVGGSPDCGPGEEIGVNGECVCVDQKLCDKAKGGGRKISKRKKSRR